VRRGAETRKQTRHFGFHAASSRSGAIFFYAEVTTARLQTLTPLFDAGRITAGVGSILSLMRECGTGGKWNCACVVVTRKTGRGVQVCVRVVLLTAALRYKV
jgi:hypothetical protein